LLLLASQRKVQYLTEETNKSEKFFPSGV
jgi:hypothetical protein